MKRWTNWQKLWLLLLCITLCSSTNMGAYAQGINDTSAIIDLRSDSNNDGLPDALVAEIEMLKALSPTNPEHVQASGVDAQYAYTRALDSFVARLPFSQATRDLQAQAAVLETLIQSADTEEEVQVLEHELRTLETTMLQDDNYARTISALQTLFLWEFQNRLQSATNNINYNNLQRGDTMLLGGNSTTANWTYALTFTHSGIADANGDGFVYESYKSGQAGVWRNSITGSWKLQGNMVALGRSNRNTTSQVEGALDWAKTKYGTNGSTAYPTIPDDKTDDSTIYCSQLLWLIHNRLSTDIDSNHAIYAAYARSIGRSDGWITRAIAPDEIAMDGDVSFYAFGFYQAQPEVYLPDVRVGQFGWRPNITVRNNSSNPNTVRIAVSNPDGIVTHDYRKDLTAYESWTVTASDAPSINGSAIVYGSQDVSAIVEHEYRWGVLSAAAYTGVETPATTVHIPLIQRNNGGFHNFISIQNTDLGSSASVTLRFEPSSSGNQCTKTYTISPYSHKLLDTQPYAQDEFSCLGSKFVGSVKITSDKPVAAAYMQYKSDYTSLIASSSTGSASATLYAPVIQNRNSGFVSGFSLLNTSSASASFSVSYHDSVQCANSSYGINSGKAVIVFPAPPSGNSCAKVVSAKFTGSTAGVQVNQIVTTTTQASDYPAISNPGRTVIVPRIRNQSDSWTSGLAVQNTGASATTVTITYYNKNGSSGGSESRSVAANQTATFFPLRTNTAPFDGSALITADQPVAVVVNHLNSGGGDNLSSHDGIHR